MVCRHCGSCDISRSGRHGGVQRFHCRSCQCYSLEWTPNFSAATKALALGIHLHNVGIRKIARFTGAAAPVITWVRKAHDAMVAKNALSPIYDTGPDIIEMDEICTFVKKNSTGRSSGLLIAGTSAVPWPITSGTTASPLLSPSTR